MKKVYIATDRELKLFKIGLTADTAKRCMALSTPPRKMKLEYSIEGDADLENTFRYFISDYRIAGTKDWHQLTAESDIFLQQTISGNNDENLKKLDKALKTIKCHKAIRSLFGSIFADIFV